VLAWTSAGYVIAGGDASAGLFAGRLAVITLRDGVAAPPRYVSGPNRSATESVIASDGTRVAVAWNEDEIDVRKLGKPGMIANNRTSIHAVVSRTARRASQMPRTPTPPPGQHDWVQAMTWDGCQFALVHTKRDQREQHPARTVFHDDRSVSASRVRL